MLTDLGVNWLITEVFQDNLSFVIPFEHHINPFKLGMLTFRQPAEALQDTDGGYVNICGEEM